VIESYDKKQLRENRDNIAIDFDGVIHSNSKGFFDGSIYDAPVDGALESIKFLSKHFKIIIFTCKAKPDRPLIGGKNGIELIKEWLDKYDMLKYISDITVEKPRALLYVDDKAVEFKNWDNCLDAIKKHL
tara:strand:- start:4058 stop:4447 length:390 start_codon:yes stop_codon:yes gene_type:complete